jgi:hypothetical protein
LSVSPIGLLVALFAVMAVFSFALGLDAFARPAAFCCAVSSKFCSASASTLSPSTPCAPTPNCVWVTRWVMLGGFAAAVIAVIAFYVIPRDGRSHVLDRLARFDYPGGEGALRFIEDDPAGTMRAIGTAVDPNVLGGMMILASALLLPQVV